MAQRPKGILRRLGAVLGVRYPAGGNDPAGREEAPLGYDLEDEAREAVRLVRSFTMATYPRLVTLYQQAVHCEAAGIKGSFVECGTWKGGAAALMALANLRRGSRRRPLHLFDSFEGIPEPDARVDGDRAVREVASVGGRAEGRLVPVKGFYERYAGGPGTLEANRHLLEEIVGYDASFIHYHKGWFQETVPREAGRAGPIAILRLDGDWYASTRVCLEHLHRQVAPGGFVIVDDYGSYEGCRKAVEEFLGGLAARPFLHHVDADARYWIIPAG